MSDQRNDSERICLIVNPQAAGGATGRRLEELERAARARFADVTIRTTERAGHATELAARAADEGFEVIAAVGGDGTAHEVVNGLFDGQALRRDDVVFAVIPAGTGSDLVKSLRIPLDIDEAMTVASAGETRATDAVLVSCADSDGSDTGRICINLVGFGMNGDVVMRANQSSKRLGGTITFLDATVRTMFAYRPPIMEIEWEDADGATGRWSGEAMSVFAANGQYCGGGMWLGRGGSMQDGLIDVTIVPKLALPRALILTPHLFTGTVDQVKGVVTARVRRLTARSPAPAVVRIDVDGEQPGVLPIELRVLQGALRVRGRW